MTITSDILAEAIAGKSLWIGLFETEVATSPDDTHCTLVYCGKDLQGEATKIALQVVHDLANEPTTFMELKESKIGGAARFSGSPDGGDPIVHLMLSPALRTARDKIISKMVELGWVRRKDDFDYTPHVTLKYMPKNETFQCVELDHPPYKFVCIVVACGNVLAKFKINATGESKVVSELNQILHS